MQIISPEQAARLDPNFRRCLAKVQLLDGRDGRVKNEYWCFKKEDHEGSHNAILPFSYVGWDDIVKKAKQE